jgi:calcineurin-like phosphoesterase family protein
MIWFTSDHHFGHANIIKHCDRPFSNVAQMDESMIHGWNLKVMPEDTVYHLGDFTLGGPEDAHGYFVQLNGNINILANPWHHDKRWIDSYPGMYTKTGEIEIMQPLLVLEIPTDGQYPLAITLCHYPLAVWDRKHYGAIHLHGHSHGKLPAEPGRLDVGVDCPCTHFRPISLNEVIERTRSYDDTEP